MIVVHHPDGVVVPKLSTFSCHDDIKLVHEFTSAKKLSEIDLLEWDYNMKHNQIWKLTGSLWKNIMGTFGMTPPMQPGNVVVLERSSMPTSVTRT